MIRRLLQTPDPDQPATAIGARLAGRVTAGTSGPPDGRSRSTARRCHAGPAPPTTPHSTGWPRATRPAAWSWPAPTWTANERDHPVPATARPARHGAGCDRREARMSKISVGRRSYVRPRRRPTSREQQPARRVTSIHHDAQRPGRCPATASPVHDKAPIRPRPGGSRPGTIRISIRAPHRHARHCTTAAVRPHERAPDLTRPVSAGHPREAPDLNSQKRALRAFPPQRSRCSSHKPPSARVGGWSTSKNVAHGCRVWVRVGYALRNGRRPSQNPESNAYSRRDAGLRAGVNRS